MKAEQLVKTLIEAPDDASEQEISRHVQQVIPRVTTRPYTAPELREMTANGERYIDLNVGVGLWDLIEHDLEWLNDTVSEKIAGSCCALTDIGYAPAGVVGDEVIINVVASVADWLAEQP